MMRQIRNRLSYANVMATLAIFLAMGGAGAMAATHLGRATVGTPQLKAGAVTGAKVKDGSLTGADVAAATLGKVPAAAHADSATNADHAGTAGRADTAARADSATNADEAGTADRAATAEALAAPEAVHYFGDPGEPRLDGSFNALSPIGFYRDDEGRVHLQGSLEATVAESRIVSEALPLRYRPALDETFFAISHTGARLVVEADGQIVVPDMAKGAVASLDGITWRAGS